MDHFNQKPLRKAEFIHPPNTLKVKVGSGGLSDDILDKAQTLLENNSVDFRPLAEMYLETLMRGLDSVADIKEPGDYESQIADMLYPGMQLKANGGMFHYPLVTKLADHLVQFLEVIEKPDDDVLEIVRAFHTTVKAIINGRIKGDGGQHGEELLSAFEDACYRYFEKNPGNVEAGRIT
jgi:hypothetical protein